MVLQENTQREAITGIDEFVHSVMKDADVVGTAIAVIKDGEVILSQGFGKRNVAEELAVTPETLFAIGSSTKAFTALAIAILVDEGKLDWDTPVRHYAPTFQLNDPVATERLTPKDLLIHSSGLPRHDLAWYNSPISRKDLFERLRYFEPNRDLRTTWQYQNMMYMAAGYLIEAVTGQTWEEFVQQRILEPLGMTSSNFSVRASQQASDFALPYRKNQEKVELIELYDRFQAVGPAGSINSHVVDMAKWLSFLLNKGTYGENGEKRLLSEAQFNLLLTPQIVCPALPTLYTKYEETFHWSYAFGWFVSSYRGHVMIQHGGNIDGFSALVTFLPDDNIGVVVLTNLDGNFITQTLTFNICDRLLGLDEAPWHDRFQNKIAELKGQLKKANEEKGADRIPDAPPTHSLSAYTGSFEHPGYGIFTITQDGERLQGRYNNLDYTFTHHHYDVFIISQERLEPILKGSFAIDLKGTIESFSLTLTFEPGTKPIIFKRVSEKIDEKVSERID